jgi:5-oxoprolinase (ATP-hydrolysing)
MHSVAQALSHAQIKMGSMTYEPVTGIKIAIDRGGTFTDIWATAPHQSDLVFKLLSVDPGNYDDAPTEGMFRT